MKILIYGLPRTRSTYLLDVLCQHYNLTNLGEPYHGILAIQSQGIFENYKSKQLEVANKLLSLDNFGLKIFTNALLNWNFGPNETNPNPKYNELKKQDLIDIYEHHNLNTYDQIYVVTRKNSIDRFCSFTQANQHNNFVFKKGQEQLIKMYSPKNKILEYKYYDVKFSLFAEILHGQLSKQLVRKKANVVCLEYDEITKFVNENYPSIESKCAENFYDYKNKIRNYNQICDDFKKAQYELDKDGVPDLISTLFSE